MWTSIQFVDSQSSNRLQHLLVLSPWLALTTLSDLCQGSLVDVEFACLLTLFMTIDRQPFQSRQKAFKIFMGFNNSLIIPLFSNVPIFSNTHTGRDWVRLWRHPNSAFNHIVISNLYNLTQNTVCFTGRASYHNLNRVCTSPDLRSRTDLVISDDCEHALLAVDVLL